MSILLWSKGDSHGLDVCSRVAKVSESSESGDKQAVVPVQLSLISLLVFLFASILFFNVNFFSF